MSDINEPLLDNRDWWAAGDTPVREHSRITYLIDGRNAMLTMCRHFLTARKYIYLANWGLSPDIQLVRGRDQRAGPDGSPEQESLVQELRAEGLGEREIAFWTNQELTIQNVLGYAVSKGIEVKALLWHSSPIFSHYKPEQARDALTSVGISCLLDDSSRGILHHPIESLHQKVTVVDGTHAFVGGIDPLIELSGDFDRWDVPIHQYASELRRNKDNPLPHSWHDAHAIIEGTAAGDVELNIRQRWNDLVQRHHWDDALLIPEHPLPEPLESRSLIQIARTIPEHTYSFDADTGIQGIAQLYAKAFANAQHFIYLENQYFWLHAFYGVDIPLIGRDSPDMERNIRELGAALRRGASVSFVLPDHPNVGRAFTDEGLERLRQEAPQAVAEGRIQAFCLGNSQNIDGEEHYRSVYVHAKVAIIDDIWSTVGSGNMNNRGMRDDTEINVATLDQTLSRGLRLMLIAEHLGLYNEVELFIVARYLGKQRQRPDIEQSAREIWNSIQQQLDNPLVALNMMVQRAQDNLRRYKEKQPFIGHLVPYLSAEEARREQLNFDEELGWLETPNIRK